MASAPLYFRGSVASDETIAPARLDLRAHRRGVGLGKAAGTHTIDRFAIHVGLAHAQRRPRELGRVFGLQPRNLTLRLGIRPGRAELNRPASTRDRFGGRRYR